MKRIGNGRGWPGTEATRARSYGRTVENGRKVVVGRAAVRDERLEEEAQETWGSGRGSAGRLLTRS